MVETLHNVHGAASHIRAYS